MQASFQQHRYSGFEPLEAFDVVYGGHFEHRLFSSKQSVMVHQRLTLGTVRLEAGSYDFPVVAQGAMPSDSFCIGFVADGLPVTRFNTEMANDSTIQIYQPRAELMYHTMGSSTWVNFAAENDLLRETIEHLPRRKRWLPNQGVQSVHICPKKRVHLRQLVSDAFVLANALRFQGISRELAEEMARALTLAYVDALLEGVMIQGKKSSEADKRSCVIRACEAVMLVPENSAWGLPRLAHTAGYSLRTLERIFQQGVGMSPGRWFRTIRLNRALRDLVFPSEAESVTNVAMRWGFLHLSRFAELYRSTFGESPSETLNRSRGRHRPCAPR